MSDPSYALQVAIVAALKAAGIARVYDTVPPDADFPYVSVGDGQVLGDDTEDCGDGSEVHLQIDVWSRATGYPEAKQIASTVRSALKAPLVLDGFDVTVAEYQQTQFLRDPDGLTRHAALTFRYLITHTS